jgi:hypothetical protein
MPTCFAAPLAPNLENFTPWNHGDGDGDGVMVNSVYGEMVNLQHAIDLYGDRVNALLCNFEPDKRFPKVFDGLSAELFNDTAVVMVAWGHWAVLPATLYHYGHLLGLDRLRGTIKEVAPKAGIRNKGAYLQALLKSLCSTVQT